MILNEKLEKITDIFLKNPKSVAWTFLTGRKAEVGVAAQLAARHVRDVEVGSSSLLTPTRYHTIILSIDSCVVFAYFAGGIAGVGQCPIELALYLFALSFYYITLFFCLPDSETEK